MGELNFKSFASLCSLVVHNAKYWPLVTESIKEDMLDDWKDRSLYSIFDQLHQRKLLQSDFVLKALTGDKKRMADPAWRNVCAEVIGGPMSLNPQPWIDGIRNHHFEKKKKSATQKLAQAAMDQNMKMIQEASLEINELDSKARESEERSDSLCELFVSTIDHLDNLLTKEVGVSTGFEELDQVIGGFDPGCFYIIAARPGIGKTAVALNFAAQAASLGFDVAFFSLEMTREQIGHRLLARKAEVENRKMRRPKTLTENDLDKIVAAAESYAKLKGKFCVRCGGYSFEDIERELRLMKTRFDIRVVFIDYLTIVKVPAGHSREREIGELSSKMKRLALDLEIAVVCLAQPNRDMEKQNRKPRNSDLRDSGQIEQDADLIMWVHREIDDSGTIVPATTLLVTKNRHGETGPVDGFYFEARYQLLRRV